MKIELDPIEPLPDSTSQELSKIILTRFGLIPRKRDGFAKMHTLLIELYERKKVANRDKKPEAAVMTVEEMGIHAGIKRQTMYDYLNRWLMLQLLKKTTFVANGKVIIGYELNGTNLESAFKKAEYAIRGIVEQGLEYVVELQNTIKKEKLRANLADDEPRPETSPDESPPTRIIPPSGSPTG